MKRKIFKVVFPIFLLFSNFFFAQFNTIMPTLPKKEEPTKIIEIQNEKLKVQKPKKTWKEVFKITSKSDLKSEIDSLKILIKEYGNVKNDQKAIFQKMKDSLLMLSRNNSHSKNNFTTKKAIYDFVEEPSETISKIVMPIRNKLTITSPYGTRIHPIFGTKKIHNGIDLKANYENVYSVMDGIITASGWDSKGGGNFIRVKHFNRFETTYMHLSERYYEIGEKVKAGFVIGKSGNTGNSTGPHLHFSVKEFGQSINPSLFLNDLIKVNNLIAIYHE